MSDNFENLDDGVYIHDNDGIITVHNLENVSFLAQLTKIPQKVHEYYLEIKSALMSDSKVQNKTYLGKECFFIKEDTIAKFNIINGTLHLYLKLSPQDIGTVDSYTRPNHIIQPNNVLTLLVINTVKDVQRAKKLINVLLQKYCNLL